MLDESEVGESNLPLKAEATADEEAVHYQDSGIVEQLDAGDSSLDNASNADNAQTSMNLQPLDGCAEASLEELVTECDGVSNGLLLVYRNVGAKGEDHRLTPDAL